MLFGNKYYYERGCPQITLGTASFIKPNFKLKNQNYLGQDPLGDADQWQ